MVEIAAKSPTRRARSLLGTPSQDLLLLVHGTQHGGQVVRLSAPKCTVGSARTCTLRLRSAGVRDVHCLIYRGRRATFVRRFDDNTRLNGRMFDSAPLAVGDRLTVGPVQLEVIDEQTAARIGRRSSTGAVTRFGRADSSQLQEVVEQARQQADQLRTSLAKTRHAATRRVQQLTKQLRSARDRLHRLQAEFQGDRERTRCVQEALADQQQQLEQQFEQRRRELEADLGRRQADLERQTAEVNQQAAEIAERKQQLARDHARRQDELETLQRQLAESRELIERQRGEAERDSQAEQALEAEAEKLEAQRIQYEADRAAWQQERQRYDDELRERTVLLERRQADLAEADQELNAARAELDTLKEELQRQGRTAEVADPQTTDGQDVDFAATQEERVSPPDDTGVGDVKDATISSLFPGGDAAAVVDPPVAHGAAQEEDSPLDVPTGTPVFSAEIPGASTEDLAEQAADSSPDSQDPFTQPAPVPQYSPLDSAPHEATAVAPNLPANRDADHDGSVEEYMADLMKRLRGDSTPPPIVDDTPYVPAGHRELEDEPNPAPADEPIPEEAPTEEPLEPSEYVPRNVAPESKTDLGALREVANTSARSAIVLHTNKRSGKGAIGKMLRAGIALLAAVAFGFWKPVMGPVAVAGAAISLVAASFWVAQAARMVSRAAFARKVPQGGRVDDSLPTE